MTRPESIENRWDILYRDYPEVYEAFSNTPYHPTVYEQLAGIIDLRGRVIADVGAGTGSSTLALARCGARWVIGIEREAAMLRVAREKLARIAPAAMVQPAAEEQPAAMVQPAAEEQLAAAEKRPGAYSDPSGRWAVLGGDALALPLADDSVDLVTGITLALWPVEQYRAFIREGLRVARGALVYLGIPPGGYGGDLYDVIDDVDIVDDAVDRIFLEEFHFHFQDIICDQDYGTLDHIVSTYGFIFGKKAIAHLRREGKTTIRWTFRVYWRELG